MLALAACTAPSAAASASWRETEWHGVATWLPAHYRLFETSRFNDVCYGDRRREQRDCDASDLDVLTLSDGPGTEIGSPDGPGHRIVVRPGHVGSWYWLQDDGYRFAREIDWEPRAGLTVGVVGYEHIPLGVLRRVAAGVRALDDRGWRLLLRQTSDAAQLGRFEPGMRRVHAASGTRGGDRWRLDVLIPPGYPLSRDDLRPACTELVFRGQRGHGEFCDGGWQRVGGQAFAFGPVPRSWRRVVTDSTAGPGSGLRARTHRVAGWPKERFFAIPLPTDNCGLYVESPDHPHADYSFLAVPVPDSPDWDRCGIGTG